MQKSSFSMLKSSLFKLLVLTLLLATILWSSLWLWQRNTNQQLLERKARAERYLEAHIRITTLAEYFHAYAGDHGGYLPLSSKWETSIAPYAIKYKEDLSKLITSPFLPGPRRFAMNKALSGCNINKLTGEEYADVILLFDSTSTQRNANDNMTSIPAITPTAEIAVITLGGKNKPFYAKMHQNTPGPKQSISLLPSAIERSRSIEKAFSMRNKIKKRP